MPSFTNDLDLNGNKLKNAVVEASGGLVKGWTGIVDLQGGVETEISHSLGTKAVLAPAITWFSGGNIGQPVQIDYKVTTADTITLLPQGRTFRGQFLVTVIGFDPET